MIVQGSYHNTTPASDGQIPIPDGAYVITCTKTEDTETKGGANKAKKPMVVLTVAFNNQSDWPAGTFKPNAVRRIFLVVPDASADDSDFTKQNFLKHVMVFMGVEKAQAASMLQTGFDTASFAGRSGYADMLTGLRKEKDADTGVEKEVHAQDLRVVSAAGYAERKGGKGAAGAGQQNAAQSQQGQQIDAEAAMRLRAAFQQQGAAQTQQPAQQTQQQVQQGVQLNPLVAQALATNPALIQVAVTSIVNRMMDQGVLAALMTNPAVLNLYLAQVAAGQ